LEQNQNCCLSFFDFRSSFEKSEPPFLFVCTTTLNHVDMAALGGAAMSYKPHQQILTFFDLSKKARPPPGIFLPLDMNY